MLSRPASPAAERNRQPILEVLKSEFEKVVNVLEIGSGTGQHAVHFAAAMPWLEWQTSDLSESHAGINAWIDEFGGSNLRRPLLLDVLEAGSTPQSYDAVFSANTAHIMCIEAVSAMFSLVGGLLSPGGPFCLYGPFNQGGEFSSESNRQFDQSLRSRDAAMGIRDLEQLDAFARAAGLVRDRIYAMPANNNLVVWCNALVDPQEKVSP